MRFISFGGVSFPEAYQDQDAPVAARSVLVELPDGAFDQDGQATVLRPGVLSFRFPVYATIDASMDALMGKLAQGRLVLKAVLRDDTTYRQTFAKLMDVRRVRSPLDKLVQQVELTFSQSFPFWFASADEPIYLDHGEVLDDGWFLDGNYTAVTINALQETATLTNAGNVPILRGKIIVRPASGASITNLTITNQTNWKILRYIGTLAYPQVLTIDLLSKSAKVDEIDAYSDIDIPSDQIDWQELEPGANSIVIDVTARTGNTAFEWHWADTYL